MQHSTSISIWEQQSFYAPSDILIVGAGLLGCWTAREIKIKYPTAKVTLIDGAAIPQGASARNAGFACFGSATELLHDAAVAGEDNMLTIAGMRFKGMQKIRAVMGDAVIGYDDCGGYECLTRTAGQNVTAGQLVQLNRLLKQVTNLDETFTEVSSKLPALGLTGFERLLFNPLEGGLNSGKLLQALLHNVQKLGVNVLMGMPVLAFAHTGNSIQVQTAGPILQTQQLVFTTNAFLPNFFPGLQIKPARGQILLTPPIAGLQLKGTFHFDAGFYYWRNLGNRILLGGARNADIAGETTTAMETSSTIQQTLLQFLHDHFEQAAGIQAHDLQTWSGIMAMSESKQPVLANPQPDVWAGMCCNGMGVALSPVFAEELAKAVTA